MNWGSSAVGQADVSQVTGTVMEHQTAWMTLMNKTAVSYLTYIHCMPIFYLRGLGFLSHLLDVSFQPEVFLSSSQRNTQILYINSIFL